MVLTMCFLKLNLLLMLILFIIAGSLTYFSTNTRVLIDNSNLVKEIMSEQQTAYVLSTIMMGEVVENKD